MALGVNAVYRFLVLSTVAACIRSQEVDATSSSCTPTTCKNGGICYNTTDYGIPEASPSCPVGWPIFYSGKCYKVLWKAVNWTEANITCRDAHQGSQLMTVDEGKILAPEFIKLMNYTHFNIPSDLWTSTCPGAFCRTLDAANQYVHNSRRIKGHEALPVCRISNSASTVQIGSQCRCRKPYIGLRCEQTASRSNVSDQVVCPSVAVTCPKKQLAFDYAVYENLTVNNDTDSCIFPRPTANSQHQAPCAPYHASTRAVLRQLCQGKRNCSLSRFLAECSEVLKIRFRCYPPDAMTCSTGQHFIPSTNDCMSILENPSTWWEAVDECRTLGGSLAFLPLNGTQALQELTSWLNESSFHSGAAPHYYPMSPYFEVWIGEVAKDLGVPSVDPQNKCSYLRVVPTGGNLTVVTDQGLHCTTAQTKHGLCQMDPTGQGDCPVGSIHVDSVAKCYRLVAEKGTLGELQAVCERRSGQLASYYANNTQQEPSLLSMLSLQYAQAMERLEGFWIAGRGDIRDPEGKWIPCATAVLNEHSTIEYAVQKQCNFNKIKRAICTFPRIFNNAATGLPPTTPIPTSAAVCKGERYQARDTEWPDTHGGETAVVPCPGSEKGVKGNATRKCGLDGKFEANPNFSNCAALDENSLLKNMNRTEVTKEAPNILLEKMREHKQLYSKDLDTTISVMEYLKDLQKKLLKNLNSTAEREKAVADIGDSMGNIIDTLLNKDNVEAWTDMPLKEQSQTATNFLVSTDDFGFMLVDALDNSFHEVNKDNIKMRVNSHSKAFYGTKGLSFPEPPDPTASIALPEGFALQVTNETVKSVFIKYENLTAILSTATFPSVSSSSNDTTFQVNSKVMGASLGSPNEKVKFDQGNVTVVITHLNIPAENPSCVFWNTATNSWDAEGCNLHNTNATHTVCECNHLTNFAVLMDVQNTLADVAKVHTVALTWITIVGCSISIVCLAISCIVFIFFRQLWGLRNAIHCNLCACLLIAQLLLLGGLDQTNIRIVCGVIAGVLHFTWLAGFMWMALEGVQIYVLLIKVFDTGEQKVWLYYLAGYGVPAIVVAVSASIFPTGYGTERYCWLSTDNSFIFSFAAPMAAIFLFNMGILIMAMKAAASVKMQRQQTKTQSAKIWIRRAASLIPLLGLTWIFGFLFVNNTSIVFAYIFAISNSLQGVFIFVYHCLRNEKVQQVVGRYFIRKRDQFESSTATKSRSNSCTGTSNARTVMTDDGSSASSTQSRGQVTKSPIYTLNGAPNVAKSKGVNKWRHKLDISNRKAVSPAFSDESFASHEPDPRESAHNVGKAARKRSKIPRIKADRVRKVSELPV